MSRGFCRVVASHGYGLGGFAVAMRTPRGIDSVVADAARMASWQGVAGAHVLVADEPAPMTKEQSIRGEDGAMANLLLVTAYDKSALERIAADQPVYELGFTATAAEVRRTPSNRPGRPRPAP
jgi:hypothetical protein